MGNPFLDPALVGALYAAPSRLASRTAALHRAKVAGADVADMIVTLLTGQIGPGGILGDIGCGRGTTTLRLARDLPGPQVVAVDASAALLDVARARLTRAGLPARCVVADFHHLPFSAASMDVLVAAFCLYHAPDPTRVVAEFGRCLRPQGIALLVTKSADSYHELDPIVAASGLDPEAETRASLYAAFHSANMADLASAQLAVATLTHHHHRFRFATFDDLAAYLVTTPRYRLPRNPAEVIARLRDWGPDRPVTMTSTVSYLMGVRR